MRDRRRRAECAEANLCRMYRRQANGQRKAEQEVQDAIHAAAALARLATSAFTGAVTAVTVAWAAVRSALSVTIAGFTSFLPVSQRSNKQCVIFNLLSISNLCRR